MVLLQRQIAHDQAFSRTVGRRRGERLAVSATEPHGEVVGQRRRTDERSVAGGGRCHRGDVRRTEFGRGYALFVLLVGGSLRQGGFRRADGGRAGVEPAGVYEGTQPRTGSL